MTGFFFPYKQGHFFQLTLFNKFNFKFRSSFDFKHALLLTYFKEFLNVFDDLISTVITYKEKIF